MKKQRGEALLAILALVSVAGLGLSLTPKAYPGTYQIINAGNAVLRIDTRTGAVEQCNLTGNTIDCSQIAVTIKPRGE